MHAAAVDGYPADPRNLQGTRPPEARRADLRSAVLDVHLGLLLARIRALLRRTREQETVADVVQKIRAYRFAGFELNVRLRRLAAPDGSNVGLTNREFNLLAVFLAAPQRVLSRDQLLSLSRLHNDEVYDRSVDVHVGRLRRKMQAAKASAELIRTERGAGYAFVAQVEIVR